MEFLRQISPEMRRKINIGLLVFTGLQFFTIFVLSTFFSEPSAPPRTQQISNADLQRSLDPAAILKQGREAAPSPKPEKIAPPKATPKGDTAKIKTSKRVKIADRANRLPAAQAAKMARLARTVKTLPPLKVSKQTRHQLPSSKGRENWKVVAKAPTSEGKSRSN